VLVYEVNSGMNKFSLEAILFLLPQNTPEAFVVADFLADGGGKHFISLHVRGRQRGKAIYFFADRGRQQTGIKKKHTTERGRRKKRERRLQKAKLIACL